jgi:uncharacterized lipoprotein YmbA
MRVLVRRLSAGLCVVIVAGTSGCSGSPPTRFYLLTPLATTERPKDVAPGPGPAVGLRPVRLPEQFDRPQIVTRVGPNRLQLAEFDQWAAPLGDTFARVLAEDLAILIPSDRVAVFPWSRESAIEYEVTVEVVRFDASLGGDCSVVADWAVFRPAGKEPPKTGRFSASGPAGGTYSELVAAQSRLIDGLAGEIATALKATRR